MVVVRYGLPLLFVAGAFAMLLAGPDDAALEGFFMGLGAAAALLLLNVFFRIGVSGDREREAEAAARDYFSRHGRWPDEA